MPIDPDAARFLKRAIRTAALTVVIASCTAAQPGSSGVDGPEIAPVPSFNPLAVRYARAQFAAEPSLLKRLLKSPFGYFRYVNGAFTQEVCRRFEPLLPIMPMVNLHGDAHLEQYAVATDGRGLADFDAAAAGPPVVDLVRFASSLHVAAFQRGHPEEASPAIEAMLEGYAHALKDPKATAPEPSVAVRIRSNFGTGTVAWLDRVEALMIPMDADKQAKMEQAGGQYVAQMLAQNPTLPASFFTLKKIGSLKMGVGSAHSAKFLGRVEGPTKAPDDDVILETKEVSQMSPGGCISGESRDPLRVIVGQTRLSNPPQQFLGYVELEGRMFYVHQWRVHYTELDIEDIQTGKELEEIAFDVGVQLGRGHPKQIADPYGKELRDTLAAALVRVAPEIRSAAKELADMNISAWKEFTEAASR